MTARHTPKTRRVTEVAQPTHRRATQTSKITKKFLLLAATAGVSLAVVSAPLNAATITFGSNFFINNNGVAADSLAQIIPGREVFGAYVSSTYLNNGRNGCVDPAPCGVTLSFTGENRTLTFQPIQPSSFSDGGSFLGATVDTGIAAYNKILAGGWQGASGRYDFDYSVTGLTAGRDYHIQIWSSSEGTQINGTSFTGSASVIPWAAVGTFTADAPTLKLNFFAGRPAMDAVLVTEIPEPATIGLLGAGLLALGMVRRVAAARREEIVALLED